MKKLFEKREVLFAVMWIVVYVVGMSVCGAVSEDILIQKSAVSVLGAVISAVLLVFIGKNSLWEYIGLCRAKISAGRMLFYVPLVAVGSVNLWFGVRLNMPVVDTVMYVISMFFAGFLEEFIFRGLLFNAMCRENVVTAFIVTSLTFGAGHIVNLINASGQSVFETLNQVVYACAIGFMLAAVAYVSRSIIPCIIMHIAINSLSTFAVKLPDSISMITTAVISVISVGYGIYLLTIRKRSETKTPETQSPRC